MSYAALKTAAEWGYRACEKGMNLQAAMIEFDKIFPPPVENEDPPLWHKVFTEAEQNTILAMVMDELSDRDTIRDNAIKTLDEYTETNIDELIAYIDPNIDVTVSCLRAIDQHAASMDDYRSYEHADHYVAAQFIERWDLVQNSEELSERGRRYMEEHTHG